ncbi:MAG TPA: hypothetical protein VN847_20485, partial [Streptosporangiaceae bacterium]|nr:hypothetical protein [Streptosporangiaceae bacterium]
MRQAGRRLRRQLTEAFATRWPVGLRAGLSVGIPLVAGALSHHASDGALASIGSFAGFYGPDAPYRHRLRLVAGVGVALTVLVPLGSLCAATAWLSVLLIGLVAATASFACLALRVPPPREYLIVLGVLAATGIPAGLTAAVREAALVAAGAVISGVITMAPALGRGRDRPQQRALAQAWSAVRHVLQTAGTPEARAARRQAVADVARAREVLDQAGPADTTDRAGGETMLRSLAAAGVALASALSVSHDAREPLDPRWVATAGRLGPGDGPPFHISDRKGSDLPGWRWALQAARRIEQGDDSELDVTRLPRPSARARLRAALNPDAVIVTSAARIGIAVAAGAAVGQALGL